MFVGHHGGARNSMGYAVCGAGFVASVDQFSLNGTDDIGIDGLVGR